MLPDWIIWAVLFTGLLALTAITLCAITVAVYLLQAYRRANPAKELHRTGKRLLSSPDRERRRMGFDLIGAAHTLDSTACTCFSKEGR